MFRNELHWVFSCFWFWCYLDGLELGDLCPQLEMEDGEDEEGEDEAQDQALHVLHPPTNPPHIPNRPLWSETNKYFPNPPHFHTAYNQSEIKAWTAEVWYWASADGVHIGRAGLPLVENLWSSVPIGCTKSAPQQHGVIYRQCLNCKCCHFCEPMFGLPDLVLWSGHWIFLRLWPSTWPEAWCRIWPSQPGTSEGHHGIFHGGAQSWHGVCKRSCLLPSHCKWTPWKSRAFVSVITPHIWVVLGWTLFSYQS